MTLADLRVAAISVLERVELVAARWPTGTVTADEVEALVSAVNGLHKDLHEHFDVAEGAGAEGLTVMLEIREGIIASAVIVSGLLAIAPPEEGTAA